MKKINSSNKLTPQLKRLKKHIWVYCGLVMLLMSTGTAWAESALTPPESGCANFVYYLSDHPLGSATTDIYKVTLNGANADLEYIISSDEEVHIAYNSEDNLIYAVGRNSHSYKTLDPNAAVPEFSPSIDLGDSLSLITAAVFFPGSNKLVFGSSSSKRIYSVNTATNVVSLYDAYSPLDGGDLAYGSDGMLYLASAANNGLFAVWPADVMPDNLISTSLPGGVTGMAITDTNQLLISSRNNTNLVLRNTDGSDAGSFAVKLNGNTFTLGSGDMASGCATNAGNVGEECGYKLYYVNSPAGGGSQPLIEVTLHTDGTASHTTLIANIGGHIGLSPDGSTIYNVASKLKVIDVATATVVSNLKIKTASGTRLSGFPACVVGSDGTLYAGNASLNQVYTIDPATGIATPFGPSRTVSGGDLIELDGEIWVVTRSNNTFTKVSTGENFTVPVTQMNGAAVLSNGNVLVADGNGGSLLKEINVSTKEIVATYDIGLPLLNGDLAGGCLIKNPVFEACYGSVIHDFSQGLQTNGNPVGADRSDPAKALGEPDRSNAAGGFVALGVGGSITIGFAGVVHDQPGNDIRIWETSYKGNVCGGVSDERADIELSADGVNFMPAGTICLDGEVDMADAGLTSVRYIRITNAASTGTLDGYDVDGVEAIYGCSNEPLVVNGECYATGVVEYIQGIEMTGGALQAARTDVNHALGLPERATSGYSYTTLGYGGSITLAFDGAVPNGPGADLEIVETTYGSATTCGGYPEYADVYVSIDGNDWHFAKTVCKFDPLVDISDAGAFTYINYVKIVNNDAQSTSPDGFDVDGVIAIHNCEGISLPSPPVAYEPQSELYTSPNPTTGRSQVTFTTAKTGKTFVDVYDMNGRKIATIFDQVAQEGQEYTFDFNGVALPNGFYVYILTNNSETVIERFIIAK